MARIGEVIDTAICKHCHKPIQQTFWGNGGTDWTHFADDEWECYKVTHAEPEGAR